MPLINNPIAAKQIGQSLAEVLVVTTALVPLVFLGIWLGKLADMQFATGAAARKIAFDCAIRREDCRDLEANSNLVDAVRRHQFAGNGREVMSLDTPEDEIDATNGQALWVSQGGKPLLARFSDVGSGITAETLDAPGRHISASNQRWVSNTVNHLSNLAGPGHFGLELYGGFIRAQVEAKTAQDFAALGSGSRLDPFPITLQRHVAILTDEWGASGVENGRLDSLKARADRGSQLPIAGQVGETALGLAYAGVRGSMSFMNAISLERTATQFRFHDPDLKILPADRKSSEAAAVANPSPPVPIVQDTGG